MYIRELYCFVFVLGGGLRSLRSSAQGEMVVPFVCTSIKQGRTFLVVGPSTWNRPRLPLDKRGVFARDSAFNFNKHSKLFFSAEVGLGAPQILERRNINDLSDVTILLCYSVKK